jgi:hypothetical protein
LLYLSATAIRSVQIPTESYINTQVCLSLRDVSKEEDEEEEEESF